MIFVVRMLQELGREKDIALFMCFIDLMKAYDTVKRGMLWRILARFGVPKKLIAIIRAFHDGMRARVRLDDGALSVWFPVKEGLRQGCVLAPLLFNIYFSAVLMIAAQKIETDEVARNALIKIRSRLDVNPLSKKANRARESRQAIVRSLWKMLYADDAGIASLDRECLSKMMTIIVQSCTLFGLSVSQPKTKTLCFEPRPKRGAAADADDSEFEMRIEASDQMYEQVKRFIYLGSLQTHNHDMGPELRRRIFASSAKLRRHSKTIFDAKRGIYLRNKMRMYNAEVLPALLYACETWTVTADHVKRLRQTHHDHLKRIIGYKRRPGKYRTLAYHKTLRITKSDHIEVTLHRLRLEFAGKIARMDDERLPKLMLFGELEGGKRRRGAPEKSWRSCFRDSLRAFEIDEEKWIELAVEKGAAEWKALIIKAAEQYMKRWLEAQDRASALRHAARAAEAEAAAEDVPQNEVDDADAHS